MSAIGGKADIGDRDEKSPLWEEVMVRLFLAFLLTLVFSATWAHAGAIEDCNQSKNLDQRIRGCTSLINQGKLSRKVLAPAYINRGITYRKKGQYDRAIADYDKAIKLNPKLAMAYNNRGTVYGNKGQYDRAIADFDKAIKLNPNYAAAYVNRGEAYRRKGQFTQAIADYDTAIKLNPKYADAYTNRGLTYEEKGDRDKAIADYRKVLELRPGDRVATSGLKRLGVTP